MKEPRDYFWKFSGKDRIIALANSDDQSPAQKHWQEATEATEKVIEALEKSVTGALTFFKRKLKFKVEESEVLENISGAGELHLDDDQRKRMDAGLEEIERTM